MKNKYLICFLIFLLLAALFTFLRTPLAEGINTLLIAIGEGRTIRVDNTDMVKRPKKQQIKISGAGKIAQAAQLKILPEKITALPVNPLIATRKKNIPRKDLFIRKWIFLGPFDLSLITGKMDLKTTLLQECMNQDIDSVSLTMTPEGMSWKAAEILTKDGKFNLSEAFRKNRKAAAAWLMTEIEVDQEYPEALMLVGLQQYGRVFLNGREVFVSTTKTPVRADGSTVKVHLKKGTNRLLLKTASRNHGNWYFYLRFTTGSKVPLIASGK